MTPDRTPALQTDTPRATRVRRAAMVGVAAALTWLAGCATTAEGPPAPIYSGGPRVEPTAPRAPGPGTPGRPIAGENNPISPIPGPPPPPVPPPRPEGYTPPHMRGQDVVRIGVLLPFGSQDARVRAEAEGLLAAIEMALFETAGSNALILPKDVGDSAALAAEAARAALTDSVDVVIGPLRAENVRAAAGVLGPAQVPLIGFSNDRSATESGALLLSFPPEEEIDRVVDWAARQGVTGFALLGPDSPFGRRVEAALAASARLRNASLIGAEFYAPTEAARLEAARRLHAAIAAPARANPGRVAVLLPEGGVNLQGVAPLMAYTGLDRRFVRLIGTGQWSDPTAWREPGLRGGTFAGPAPGAAGDFDARFQAAFGRRPTRLATLGYDAAALAISLLREDGDVTRQDLLDPQGFVGLDGLFRFRGDGTVERGLAILQIEDGRLGVAEQPPQVFGQPAS